VFDKAGAQHSTLDLCGHGKFTVLTGIGGEAWVDAAKNAGKELGLTIEAHVIGPRRDYEDYVGDWARAREISDSGCILVRPDHHVAWRAMAVTKSAQSDLSNALKRILGH
jgi:2,4-dichlorophenol 6-monooxygenase